MNNLMVPEGYIEITELHDLQKLLLITLEKFHVLCEENHLRYNLFGGTMLGAVRHQGMIPWDDDIDVTMPRPDYERLIQIIRSNPNEEYTIYNFPDRDYAYPFAKFALKGTVIFENTKRRYSRLGLYVDVFPVDGYPNDKENIYFKKLAKYKRFRCKAVYKSHMDDGLIGKILYLGKVIVSSFCELRGVNYYLNNEIMLAKKFDFDKSDVILCQGAGWNQKGKLRKDVYLNRKLYEFNGLKVWGLRDYDEHLTQLYGDYMKLPLEEKRVSNHDYKLYVNCKIYETIFGGKGE